MFANIVGIIFTFLAFYRAPMIATKFFTSYLAECIELLFLNSWKHARRA